MNIRHRVTLTPDERHQLLALTRGGTRAARQIKRAQILLAADAHVPDERIAADIGVGTSTVYRTKHHFVEDGLARALREMPRPGAPRKLSASDEAHLVAVACSAPPTGRARWTLDLLAGELVRLTTHETLSSATVGRRLAELKLKPWREKMWCIPTVNAEYVARMEDVLDLYAEAPDPQRPVVCFDETPRQLIGETRVPIPAAPGKPARIDYEYERRGTANVFLFVDVHRPWRHAKVTDHRTGLDFAACMRDLVDEHYPQADRIRVVLDNLSTHSAAALYQAFEPSEARRILRRLEFHFTPKHASWLNMVEIEIGVMVQQCLDRRIPDKATLVAEIVAWEQQRNREHAHINWVFTVDRARTKMGRVYPQPASRATPAA
jgi:transposase